jgi:hypothetical protein
MVDLQESERLHRGLQHTRHVDLLRELEAAAVRYARLRVDWLLCEPAQRSDLAATRTRAHDAFIACCDILARAMAEAGEDSSWRRRLGTDRKDIGDFACYLHAVLGIAAR